VLAPEGLAGPGDLKSLRSDLSSLTPGRRLCFQESGDTMFDERKRRDVSLLLTAQLPQERVAQQLRVSLRTVQRIAREMREGEPPTKAEPAAVPAPRGAPPGREPVCYEGSVFVRVGVGHLVSTQHRSGSARPDLTSSCS